MKKVCIKSDGTFETGSRIIEYLEGLGSVNIDCLKGGLSVYYCINDKNEIYCRSSFPAGYELITLPEPTPEKTFPREMWVWDDNELWPYKKTVIGLFKDRYVADIDFDDIWSIYKHAKEIEPPKPIIYTEEEVLKLCKRSYNLRTIDKDVRDTGSFNEWFNENKKK